MNNDWKADAVFQSTLPAGEATLSAYLLPSLQRISIHASRGGSDAIHLVKRSSITNFNPRFPRGKRPVRRRLFPSVVGFQSTLPAGEATPSTSIKVATMGFQSTLPAGEATQLRCIQYRYLRFQSTLPAGEATSGDPSATFPPQISIHASRGGSDYSSPACHSASG